MIQSVESFIKYFDGVRERTKRYINTIPGHKLGWRVNRKEFSCGEIVRHIISAEQMFVGAVVEGRWSYAGHKHQSQKRSNLDELIMRMDRTHHEAMSALATLSDEELYQKRPTLKGPPVSAWRLLMAMVEHEIHHRSQLADHLTMMGVEPPQIYGMGVEEVITLAVG